MNSYDKARLVKKMLKACEGLEDLEDCMIHALEVVLEETKPKGCCFG